MTIHAVHTLPDGTAVGVDDDGKFYRGKSRKAGWDEIVVTVEVDGDSVVKTHRIGDTIVGNERLDKTAWIAQNAAELRGSFVAGGASDKDADAAASKAAAAAWEAEVAVVSHAPVFQDVLVVGADGELTPATVEKKRTVYDWKPA